MKSAFHPSNSARSPPSGRTVFFNIAISNSLRQAGWVAIHRPSTHGQVSKAMILHLSLVSLGLLPHISSSVQLTSISRSVPDVAPVVRHTASPDRPWISCISSCALPYPSLRSLHLPGSNRPLPAMIWDLVLRFKQLGRTSRHFLSRCALLSSPILLHCCGATRSCHNDQMSIAPVRLSFPLSPFSLSDMSVDDAQEL